MSRIQDLVRFYGLLSRLEQHVGGMRHLGRFSEYQYWPSRGVYFFFEPAEYRTDSGLGLRVVRVGTHALASGSQSTLRQRLGQHRGAASGGGNHRGSIFRLLLGTALMEQGSVATCTSWGVKAQAGIAAAELGISRQALGVAETPIEQAVTQYLGAMPFLWVNIPDVPGPTSLRGTIERNAIALLSNHARAVLDPASDGWLGRRCNRPLVRSSGLWNQRHTDEVHDPAFLDAMEELLSAAPGA